jgi:tetratricopeptide (TPR) repeat protein
MAEPDNPTYLDTYAWILHKAGKYELALKYIEKANQSGGDEDPDILEHYGDILYALDRKDEALKYWNKAKDVGSESEELKEKIENLR